ncbi:MAG: hypothetical protein V4437_00855 [Patescibacteria group bacterium]
MNIRNWAIGFIIVVLIGGGMYFYSASQLHTNEEKLMHENSSADAMMHATTTADSMMHDASSTNAMMHTGSTTMMEETKSDSMMSH